MNTTEQEKETEIVSGTIGSVIKKKEGTWQVEIDTGQQNPRGLWTKDAELVRALDAKFGQAGAFVCGISHWTNQSGTQVRSLWINSVSDGEAGNGQNATPAARSPQAPEIPADYKSRPWGGADSGGMTPEKWDAKERRDYRSRAWAQTLAAFQHTIKVDEDPVAVFERLQPFQRKVYVDVTGMFAFPADESDIPFD